MSLIHLLKVSYAEYHHYSELISNKNPKSNQPEAAAEEYRSCREGGATEASPLIFALVSAPLVQNFKCTLTLLFDLDAALTHL